VGGGGGGGGGYTGGNGGDGFAAPLTAGFGYPANDSGGGGTSFDAGTNQMFSVAMSVGDGVVMITPPPPTITPETPSVVEAFQTTDIATVAPAGAGDTLTLTQTGGSGGLSLGPVQADGTQQVIYTAPGIIPASTTDAVSYQVTEQQDGATAFGSGSVQLDSGPNISAVTSPVLEQGQSTSIGTVKPGLPGDTLILTWQTSPTANGTVSLTPLSARTGDAEVIYTAPASITADTAVSVSYRISDQHADATEVVVTNVYLHGAPPRPPSHYGEVQVIYTAPASITASTTVPVSYQISDQQDGTSASGLASVQLDAGPTIRALAASSVQNGQSTEIATVIPGRPGDTLILQQTTPPPGRIPSVFLQLSSFGVYEVIYTAPGNLNSSPTQKVTYSVTDQHNDVVAFGTAFVGGNISQSVTANGDTTVILGGGNDTVTLSGTSNAVFLGNGNDKVTVSGGGNTISLGSGNDTVQGGTGDTIQLTGKGNLSVSGKSELVFLGGSPDIVTDTGQGLRLNIGPTAGNDSLVNFASDLSSGIIDLLGGIGGYTAASQAYAPLQNDGHGGALLPFGHASSLDIVGVKTSQLSANNIHIG
jgi:hypothetical protein